MILNSKFQIPNASELFKSLKNVRSEWRSKTPKQKWCYLYGIGQAAYSLLRIPILNDVNRVHWFGYAFFANASITMLISLYTVSYYAYHGEIQMGLPSTCLASVWIGHFPTLIKILLQGRFKLQSLIDFGGRYIYHDNHEKTEYNRICSDHMDTTMKRFVIKMGIMSMSAFSFITGLLSAYFIHGIPSTLLDAHIPFTAAKSNEEFIGNFLLQTILGVHGLIAYIGLECFLSILESTVSIAPQLVKSDLKNSIKLYENKSISELQLNVKIGNVVKQSLDADNYIIDLSEIFHWRNLFNPIAFIYAIAMSIFCQYTMDFHAGYGMAFGSWVQFFFICELGEKTEDNGFADMLYQTKWEVLPLNIQKTIMLLIHRKQNEKGLKMGPLGIGINRESFKLSTNKIYTFVMFLRNFFE